jgi:ATP-binding cassette subfamily B protein
MNIGPTIFQRGGIDAPGYEEALAHKLAPGTWKKVLAFGRAYRGRLALCLTLVLFDAMLNVVGPLIYRHLINNGILAYNSKVVLKFAWLLVGTAFLGACNAFALRGATMWLGQMILYDLRVKVFDHIQRMPIVFFTRTRTGTLVTRLNADISGVRDAFTDFITTTVGNGVTILFVLVTMFALSWQITLIIVALIPLSLVPARYIGRRVQKLTRESYDCAAAMNSFMIERFNVAGALVSKIFGDPGEERAHFEKNVGRVRDIGFKVSTYTRFYFISLGLAFSLGTAAVYGWGGEMVVRHLLDFGTLTALTAYLFKISGPLTGLSNIQVSVMTALISFERIFSVLDLKPTIVEKADAMAIPAGPARITFDHVFFRYPSAEEVSLASLESIALPMEHPDKDVLQDISFVAAPGDLVALVGRSGAGKTSLGQLLARLYDVRAGSICINGVDLRDATLDSIRHTVGMVMQDAHLFHDTIRANLLYAKPSATEEEMMEALHAAQILPLIQSLSAGLDTVVGDRGYRMSGGEKQRIAIARLLLKGPAVVVLDEATAHLDSASEQAFQKAFHFAREHRTSIVIAHRLSTIRSADQILVIDQGRIVERGRHEDLLQANKLYAELYRTQFAQ